MKFNNITWISALLFFFTLFTYSSSVEAKGIDVQVIYVDKLYPDIEEKSNLVKPVYVLFPKEKPQIINGRVFIPLRSLAELSGAKVHQTGDGLISQSYLDKDYKLKIDQKTWTDGDEAYETEAAPILINGTTMVHVRLFENLFDKKVSWDSSNKSVVIEPLEGSFQHDKLQLLDYTVNYNKETNSYEVKTITIKNISQQEIPQNNLWFWGINGRGLNVGKFNAKPITSGETFTLTFKLNPPEIKSSCTLFKALIEGTDEFEEITGWRIIPYPPG